MLENVFFIVANFYIQIVFSTTYYWNKWYKGNMHLLNYTYLIIKAIQKIKIKEEKPNV